MSTRAATRLALPALLLAAAIPAPAAAQDGEARGDSWAGAEIIVSGRNAVETSEPVVTRQARTISRETDLRHTPLARFGEFACPGVAGLKVEFAEIIVSRIRLIAEELDIPLHPEGKCSPNIFVIFTEDGRADLAEMERRTRQVSQVLTVKERRELLEEPGPVRVFSVVETRMRNGITIPRRRDLVNIPVGTQEGGQSLISNGIRRDIVASMVLFDREHVGAMTLHQLADYAAMRVFARTRDAEGEDAPDSILTLFDEDNPSPPDGLTAFDRAFLTTLYESVPYTSGQGNLQRVAHTLRKQLEAEE